MKKNFFKRGMAGLLSLVMCLTALVGIGTTTAYAAGERAEVYLVSFPRSGDANIDYSGTWGHPNLRYMNGWHSGESKYTTIRAMHSYDGNICYCIEPGVQQDTGDTYTSKDETFWDNLPSDINSTISPYDIKLFIGRIMQYGYTGPISTSWRSQNPADAATLAEAKIIFLNDFRMGRERQRLLNHPICELIQLLHKTNPLTEPFHTPIHEIFASIRAASGVCHDPHMWM